MPHSAFIQGCIKISLLALGSNRADAFIRRFATDADEAYAATRGRADARLRTTAGRALLRATLEDCGKPKTAAWRIESAGNGKPYAVSPDGGCGPPISISHSHNRVAVAVGLHHQGSVGIDVEYHDPRRSVAALARAAFGPREAAEVERNERSFYRIWTLREAMAKATGDGLTRAADGKDLVAGLEGVHTSTIGDGPCRLWHIASLAPAPDYSLALALHGLTRDLDRSWSPDCLSLKYYPDGA